MVYGVAHALFLKMYQVLFLRDTSRKAIAIGDTSRKAIVIGASKANPLVEIVSVFSSRHSTCVVAYNPHFYTKRGSDRPISFPPLFIQ